MKKTLSILIAMVGFVPLVAGAYMVQNYSVSSSNSGGITANGGESVTTGASDAYSEVHTIITGNDSGGTSTVYVKTDTNGVVHEQTITKAIPPGTGIAVEANVSSGATTTARMRISTSTLGGLSASSTVHASFKNAFFGGVSRVFRSFFSWFGR